MGCEIPPSIPPHAGGRRRATIPPHAGGGKGGRSWVKVGDPAPTDPGQCTFLALDTKTPYTAQFAGADGGKTAHYLLRRVTPRGDNGPLERNG